MNAYIKKGKQKFVDKVTEINNLKAKIKRVANKDVEELLQEIEFLEDKIIQLERQLDTHKSQSRYVSPDWTTYQMPLVNYNIVTNGTLTTDTAGAMNLTDPELEVVPEPFTVRI